VADHDGGSGFWSDEDNVFNHIGTSAVFCHGTCPGISISPIYYNDSGAPNMQGATNSKLHDVSGVCIAPTIVQLAPGQSWTGTAAEVVASAGRRSTPGPLVAPAVSPPVNATQNNLDTQTCVKFGVRPCDNSKNSQKWRLMSGVTPGDGKPTTIKSAVEYNATCMQAGNGGFGSGITVDYLSNVNGGHGGCPSQDMDADGCKPLPTQPYDPKNKSSTCRYDQAFVFNKNGTIALWNTRQSHDNVIAYMHHCMQIADDKGSVELAECSAAVADTDMTPLLSPTLTAAAGFERLPQGQACANGTTLTTRAACQDALKSLMSTLPAGCKDNTGCCTGENLPYGCSFRSDNDFVFNDNKQSPSKYVAGNGRQAICHCPGGATHCKSPTPPGPPPPPPPGPPGPAPPPPSPKPNSPSQKWEVGTNSDGTITIRQGKLCVDNNYRVWSPPSQGEAGAV
jgi:hypothetical protein